MPNNRGIPENNSDGTQRAGILAPAVNATGAAIGDLDLVRVDHEDRIADLENLTESTADKVDDLGKRDFATKSELDSARGALEGKDNFHDSAIEGLQQRMQSLEAAQISTGVNVAPGSSVIPPVNRDDTGSYIPGQVPITQPDGSIGLGTPGSLGIYGTHKKLDGTQEFIEVPSASKLIIGYPGADLTVSGSNNDEVLVTFDGGGSSGGGGGDPGASAQSLALLRPMPAVGQWYLPGQTLQGDGAASAGWVLFAPLLVTAPMTIDRVAFITVSQTGNSSRLGIYSADPVTGLPLTRLAQTPAVGNAGQYNVTQVVLGATLQPGLYWRAYAGLNNLTPEVEPLAGGYTNLLGGGVSATVVNSRYRTFCLNLSDYDNVPMPASVSVSELLVQTSPLPAIFIRRSA